MAFTVYSGPSLLNPQTEIEVLATTNSSNRKTGDMVQMWIMLKDMHPVMAVRSGCDDAICGDCVHRKQPRTCYVNVGMGAAMAWKGESKPADLRAITKGKLVRLGAYGDPAAVPTHVWDMVTEHAEGWTGYTHQWRTCDPALKKYCMASVESREEMDEARAAGWRTYRVVQSTEPNELNTREIVCPTEHSDIQCKDCGYCNGTSEGHKGSVCIPVHGPAYVINRFNQSKAA